MFDRFFVVVAKAGGHTFAWHFREATLNETLKHLGIMAADKELPEFTWHHAARVAMEMKRRVAAAQPWAAQG